jgi:hypothetical protein
MTQTTIPTLQEILEKYKKAFLEKLEWHCNVYKVMGSGTFESPMWFQYRGDPGLSDPNLIEFASSQVGIQFLLPIEEEDMNHSTLVTTTQPMITFAHSNTNTFKSTTPPSGGSFAKILLI